MLATKSVQSSLRCFCKTDFQRLFPYELYYFICCRNHRMEVDTFVLQLVVVFRDHGVDVGESIMQLAILGPVSAFVPLSASGLYIQPARLSHLLEYILHTKMQPCLKPLKKKKKCTGGVGKKNASTLPWIGLDSWLH